MANRYTSFAICHPQIVMKLTDVIAQLEAFANPNALAEMQRVGITASKTYGISAPQLRQLAKTIGKDHALAQALWATGSLDARIVASLIDDPKQVTERQMERWVKDFDNWAVCDGCCGNLFDQTPWAYEKAIEWTKREAEYVRRAGFALMAYLAVHDKAAKDEAFLAFLPIIKTGATDERNFVKKAVNWALRQIGKRNAKLNRAAIKTAREIQKMDSKAARWVAADALRELKGEAVQGRLQKKW
jgi:3-methyladenine DNA glycosylase AlkD